MKVIIDTSAMRLVERTREIQAVAIANIAAVAMTRINKQKPPEPLPNTMQWVSEKQERFVKRMFASKRMHKYRRGRGNGLPWQTSQSLNNSYVIMKEQIGETSIISTASYAQYVVGDQQSQLHRGRWKTAEEVVIEMYNDGTVDRIITEAFGHIFGEIKM